MPSLDRKVRAIDKPAATGGGGGIISDGGGTGIGPAVPAPTAPQGLALGTPYLLHSALGARAGVNATWRAPAGLIPDSYLIQWAFDSGFTAPTSRAVAKGQTSAAIDDLPVAMAVYVRVAAVIRGVQGAWSNVATATTPGDTVAPSAPTSPGYIWRGDTGNLYLSCTPPTEANYRDVRWRIYDASGGTLLHTYYSADGRATWTLAEHAVDTSGVYDAAVYAVADARNWSDAYSSSVAISPTLATPSTPSGLSSTWASDTGVAGPDLTTLWTLDPNVAGYRLTLDGTARDVGLVNRHTYTLATNAAEHAGTPDPAISVSLVAVDALGQISSAATLGATNAAPPATTISAAGAFSTFSLTIAASAAADLQDYRVRAYLNGSGTPSATIYTKELLLLYEPPSTGSWRFDVSPRDVFGQHGTASALSTAASTTSMAAFVQDLRREIVYSDSLGTNADTLEAALADDVTGSGGIAYASGAWRFILADWGEVIRHRTTTLSLSASVSVYLGTSQDGVTWAYHYGGSVSGGVWTPSSSTATEATAQAGATSMSGLIRIELSATQRARYIKLGINGSVTVREFYPRRLVQTDDLQAEAITARLIAVGTITGDRIAAGAITASLISVASLSAISANLGTITAGSIGAVTITGATISGGSVTGGGGKVVLNASGLTINDTALDGTTRINFSSGAYMGRVAGTTPATRTAIIDSAAVEIAGAVGNIAFDAAKGRNAYTGPSQGVLAYSGGVYLQGVLYPEDGIWVESVNAPSLANSWVNYGAPYVTAGYFIDAFGLVHLQGLIKSGTTTAGTPICNLPSGYRPSADMIVVTTSNGAPATINIRTSGNIECGSGVSATWLSLNIPPFRAA